MRKFLLFAVVLSLMMLAACGQAVQQPTPVPESKTVAPLLSEGPAETDTITCVYPTVEVFYEHEDGLISLMIPVSSWDYEIIPYDQASEQCAIAFWPIDHPGKKVALYYYSRGFGVCGTGLTTRELTLTNGMTVSMGSYDDLESWSYISFGNGYAAQNEGASAWWAERGDEALQILGSAVLCKEVVSCTSERPS